MQDATDQLGREYLDFYLDMIKSLEASEGKRIVDVLDIHWYTEAEADGKPLVVVAPGSPSQSANSSKTEIEARVQAPRSLWDPTYVEDSFIAKGYYGKDVPIRLHSLAQEKNCCPLSRHKAGYHRV